jgi:hypothetical protein
VDARVELEKDAEGVSATYVREDLGLVIGHHGGPRSTLFCSTQEITAGRWTPPRGARRLDSCSARRYTSTRRPGSVSPLGRGPGVRHHSPFTNAQQSELLLLRPTALLVSARSSHDSGAAA